MHQTHGGFSLNKTFSAAMGALLILRGLLGFMSNGKALGILSSSPDHNFLHLFAGTCLLWAGVWAKRSTARGWNKFVGWLYALIAFFGITGIDFLVEHMNANTWADNMFNVLVATASLAVGHFGARLRQRGLSFMQAMNWPFGKT